MERSFFGKNMPIPRIDADTREFWASCRDQKLIVQCCSVCRSYRFAPSPICYECQSFSYENVTSKGTGEVFTWTITYKPLHPAVREALPYNIVVVKLDDCGGAMIASNLIDVQNDRITAGMKVRVFWEVVTDEITLPRFVPA
jgi:uncharacterized OB-fold protein